MPGQTIALPFQTGVDQKTHPAWLAPGSNTSVKNGAFRKGGAVEKRYGFTRLLALAQNFGSILAGARLVSRASELVAIDGGSLFGYSPTNQLWYQRDRLPEAVATWDVIAQTTSLYDFMDVAHLDGMLVFTFIADIIGIGFRSPYWMAVDAATGAVIVPPSQVPGVSNSVNYSATKIVAVGSAGSQVGILTFLNTATGTLYVSNITNASSGMTASAATSLFSTVALNSVFYDLVAIPGTSTFALAFENTTTNGKAEFRCYSAVYTLLGNVQFPETNAGLTGFAMAALSSSLIWFNYYQPGGNFQTARLTQAGSIVGTITGTLTPTNTGVQGAGACIINSTSQMLCYTCQLGGPPLFEAREIQTNGSSSQPIGTLRRLPNCSLASKPFLQGISVYCQVMYKLGQPTLPTEGSLYLVDLDAVNPSSTRLVRPVATVAPRANAALTGRPSNVVQIGSSSKWVGVTALLGAAWANNGGFTFAPIIFNRVTYDFAASNRWQPAELGGLLYLSGGVPFVYDGQHCFEAGFLWYGDTPTATLQAGLLSGVYQYKTVYEQYDAQGNLHQSAASPALSVTAANQQITVSSTNLNLTQRVSVVFAWDIGKTLSLALYRTVAGGTTFYRVPGSTRVLDDVLSTTGVTSFIDTTSDADLQTSPILYDTGAVDNFCPPSFTCLVAHKNRIWGVAGDGVTIWYSKGAVAGSAPGFSDAFTVVVPEGGRITALASMDDYLVIFKADRVLFLAGDGALDTGDGSQLGTPVRIPTDVGCIEPRSVLVTPMGCFFQSRIGVYLLTRDRQVQYIGKAVEDTLAQNPAINSAVFCPTQSEVRFTARPSDTAASSVGLTFNYLFNAWSVQLYNNEGGGAGNDTVVSAAAVGGSYYMLGGNGYTYQETAGVGNNSYTDNLNYVSLSVQSAWLKLGNIEGYQRLRRARLVADNNDPCNVQMTIRSNLNSTQVNLPVTFPATQLTGQRPLRLECHVAANMTKAEAIQVTLADTAPTGGPTITTGKGPTFIGLVIEAQMLSRPFTQLVASTQKG